MEQENMSPQEWKEVLTIMVKYNPKFNIAKSCLEYMDNHPSTTPTDKQQHWISKIWVNSKEQKQWYQDQQAQVNKSFSQKMDDKLQVKQGNIPTSIFEIKRYSQQVQDNLPVQPNKYTLDTSNANVKKTRLELFDQLFNDE